jgi:NAD(P)-dependent dehydrogenase (short-subunit alcohol dehydrogenase family)
MGQLDGRVALVGGASRGIGKGIAMELAAAGARVYVAGRTLDRAARSADGGSLVETVDAVRALGGEAMAAQCDFSDDDAIRRLFEQVSAEAGRLDVLVNSVFSAATFGSSIGRRFWELPVDMWRDVVDLGTRSAYVASVYAAPLLLASPPALIVNVSGRGAARYRYNVAYGVGKAATDKMTADMAEELRPEGVAVVSIWPGVTLTETLAASGPVDTDGIPLDQHLASLETPRYSGRAVAALAADPGVIERSGRRFWVAALAAEYGLTDEHGRSHPLPE